MMVSKSVMTVLLAGAAAMVLSVAPAQAGGYVKGRAAVTNPNGGVTTVGGSAARGPNGGYARGRAVTTNGAGSGQAVSGGAVYGPNGSAVRGANTTVNNGAVTRNSGAAASGVNGSAQTQGAFQRNPDGTYAGQRTTSAKDANGNTYNATTTYDNNGAVRSVTCANAAGQVIACPTR